MGSLRARHLSESCDFTELTGTGCMTKAAPANTFERESVRSSRLTYRVRAHACVHQNFAADIPCVCLCARTQSLSCARLCATPQISPSGSSVHGISQARILELAALSSYRGSSWSTKRTHVFCTEVGSLPPCHVGKPQLSSLSLLMSDYKWPKCLRPVCNARDRLRCSMKPGTKFLFMRHLSLRVNTTLTHLQAFSK